MSTKTEATGESLDEFIARVEGAHFRTDEDTGANECAMLVWNMVRQYAGKPRLRKNDLRSYCKSCSAYHLRPLHDAVEQTAAN